MGNIDLPAPRPRQSLDDELPGLGILRRALSLLPRFQNGGIVEEVSTIFSDVLSFIRSQFDRRRELFSGAPGFQNGGQVSGPGTGTSDSIPARLSAGEFVVNAAATRRNLGLLQSINSGRGYANGGIVGRNLPRFQQGGQIAAPAANDNTVTDGERAIAQQLREIAGLTLSLIHI